MYEANEPREITFSIRLASVEGRKLDVGWEHVGLTPRRSPLYPRMAPNTEFAVTRLPKGQCYYP